MTLPLVTREQIIRHFDSIIDTSDIGSLLTKIANDLQGGKLEDARFKLEVLGCFYDTVPACSFFRSGAVNYAHYVALRHAYQEQQSR